MSQISRSCHKICLPRVPFLFPVTRHVCSTSQFTHVCPNSPPDPPARQPLCSSLSARDMLQEQSPDLPCPAGLPCSCPSHQKATHIGCLLRRILGGTSKFRMGALEPPGCPGTTIFRLISCSAPAVLLPLPRPRLPTQISQSNPCVTSSNLGAGQGEPRMLTVPPRDAHPARPARDHLPLSQWSRFQSGSCLTFIPQSPSTPPRKLPRPEARGKPPHLTEDRGRVWVCSEAQPRSLPTTQNPSPAV